VTVAALAMDRAKGGDELIVGAESGHLYLAPALHKQAAKPRGMMGVGLDGGGGAGVGVGVAAVQPVRCVLGCVMLGWCVVLGWGGVMLWWVGCKVVVGLMGESPITLHTHSWARTTGW
jgi:hypothetical protein